VITNGGQGEAALSIRANAYFTEGPWPIHVPGRGSVVREWALSTSHQWYDFTVLGKHFERRFAGRMETGESGFSDPAMAYSRFNEPVS
jgi:phospholipase C